MRYISLGVVVGALSGCTLNPLANVPTNKDTESMIDRQLQTGNVEPSAAYTRRGVLRPTAEPTPYVELTPILDLKNATPAPTVSSTEAGNLKPLATPRPLPTARPVTNPIIGKVATKPSYGSAGGVIQPKPIIIPPTKPIKPISTPIVIMPTKTTQPTAVATPTPDNDIFNPANSPYVSTPALTPDVTPPVIPATPVIKLPTRSIPTTIPTDVPVNIQPVATSYTPIAKNVPATPQPDTHIPMTATPTPSKIKSN
jgi:hypothetical protein